MSFETQKWVKLLNSKLGKDWTTWNSETLFAELTDEMGSRPSDEDFQKVMALRAYLNENNMFFNHVMVFEKCCLAINGLDVVTDELQFLKPEEIDYALQALGKIRAMEKFSLDVAEYVRVCCNMDGLVCYPDSMKQFQMDESLCVDVKKVPETDELTVTGVQQNKLYAIGEYVKMKRKAS